MSRFSLIRGWLECSFEDVSVVAEIVEEHWKCFPGHSLTEQQAELYRRGWFFPLSPMNWVSLVFYGGNVNEQAVDFIKECLKKIVNTEMEVCGVFFVDDEENEDMRLWTLDEGTFKDAKRDFSVKPKLIE